MVFNAKLSRDLRFRRIKDCVDPLVPWAGVDPSSSESSPVCGGVSVLTKDLKDG